MTNRRDELGEVARRLRELQRTSPRSSEGLAPWYEAARSFSRWLDAQSCAADLPAQVMHYLHDADIRIKDGGLRATQDEILNEIIADLERGDIPASRGVTVAVDVRWVAILGLLLLAAIIYWAST